MSDGDAEVRYWEDLVAAFEKEYPGSKVDFVWVPWDGAFQKKLVAIESGQTPDISWAGAEQSITFASMDALLPLDDVVQELGGASAFIDDLKWHQWNGHFWSVLGFEAGYLFYYRRDILQKAGYEGCPATWDKVMEIAAKVNDPDNNIYAIGFNYSADNGTRQIYQSIMPTFGGRELDENGKVAVNIPENAALLKFYTDPVRLGYTPPGAYAVTSYQITASPLDDWFEAGQIAMTIRPTNNALIWPKDKPDLWANTGVCPLPAGPAGHTGTFAQPGAMYVFKNTKNPELAKAFIKFFLRKDNAKTFSEISTYPIYKDMDYSYANEEWFRYLKEALKYGSRSGYPTIHPKNGIAEETFWPAQMIQDVVLNNMSVEDALKKWQVEVEKIYGEPASPLVQP